MNKITIPFFFNASAFKGNSGKPEKMDFTYFYNKDLELYQQQSTKEIDVLLDVVYAEGSMMNGEMDFNHGGMQGKASLEFILKCVQDKTSVFEIGCGNGFLLKELHKLGYQCYGLEPGPQSDQLKMACPQVEVIRDFFPTKNITKTFDLITHFNVMEHVKNPVEFILEQKRLLTSKGKIVFGVPNCEPNLLVGDLSIFLHEHYQYFTADSLFNLAASTGFHIERIEYGANNGMIFCAFVQNDVKSCHKPNHRWESFDYKKPLLSLGKELNNYDQDEIGIYCPKRAINSLYLLGISDCRFVDDTKALHGKYMPTFNNPVESFEQFKAHPPKLLVIFSRTFAKEIYEKCAQTKAFQNTKICLLQDFDER